MESAGVRRRGKQTKEQNRTSDAADNIGQVQHNSQLRLDDTPGPGRKPPSFRVDLSKKPEERYSHIVPHLLPHIRRAKLTDIFDDLISQIAPGVIGFIIQKSAPYVLRRLYNDEENAELQGIAKATDMPMYLLVAFNVLLDLLLGCTSGGVRVEEPVGKRGSMTDWHSHMVHFRTLDWGMDPLREIVVELNYVRAAGGPVVATTIGYFGYVGVLTGVRKGLSMSLNFRPRHDDSTLRKRIDFRKHQLMVLLGLRPSISSNLRRYLLEDPEEDGVSRTQRQNGASGQQPTERKEMQMGFNIKQIITELSASASTSAYLIFCTPWSVFCFEKDNHKAFVRTSDTFLVTYNHDASDEGDPQALMTATQHLQSSNAKATTGMEEIVEFSMDRKQAVDNAYRKCVKRRRRRLGRTGDALDLEDVLTIVHDKWVKNEETHYAVVMDPQRGKVLWSRAFDTEVESDVERDEA